MAVGKKGRELGLCVKWDRQGAGLGEMCRLA